MERSAFPASNLASEVLMHWTVEVSECFNFFEVQRELQMKHEIMMHIMMKSKILDTIDTLPRPIQILSLVVTSSACRRKQTI